MAKTWILDTETKGTGAHVAPLPSHERRGAHPERPLQTVQLRRPPHPAPDAEDLAAQARRFKIVDVRSAEVLGEELDTQRAADALARMPSPLDARVYVWEEQRSRWRLLDLANTRSLWELARRAVAGEQTEERGRRSSDGIDPGIAADLP